MAGLIVIKFKRMIIKVWRIKFHKAITSNPCSATTKAIVESLEENRGIGMALTTRLFCLCQIREPVSSLASQMTLLITRFWVVQWWTCRRTWAKINPRKMKMMWRLARVMRAKMTRMMTTWPEWGVRWAWLWCKTSSGNPSQTRRMKHWSWRDRSSILKCVELVSAKTDKRAKSSSPSATCRTSVGGVASVIAHLPCASA